MKISKKIVEIWLSIAAVIIACEDTKVEPDRDRESNPCDQQCLRTILRLIWRLERSLPVFLIDQPPVNLSVSYQGSGTSNSDVTM